MKKFLSLALILVLTLGCFSGCQLQDNRTVINVYNCGQSGAFNTHGRRAEMTEDQNVVSDQIHQHSGNAAQHGNSGFTGFAEGTGVSICQCEGGEAPDHNLQIAHAVFHGTCCGKGITFSCEIEPDQCGAQEQEACSSQKSDETADQNLEAEGVADSLMVLRTVELGGENTRAGTGAKDAEIENKDDSVDDRYTAHGNGAHLADHNVVQKIDKIGDAVLNDDGDGNPQDTAVKCPVTDISLQHDKPQDNIECKQIVTELLKQGPKSPEYGSMEGQKKQSGNGRTGKYVSDGYNCNLVVKKSVTICNFPIDERNNLVYNAYKKEHRNAMALEITVSKAKMAAANPVTYFEIILGGFEK